MFKENEIVILLGAGCSADAGISTSQNMVGKLEHLLSNKSGWREFKNCFYYIKSSLLFVNGIKGDFENKIDIERFVNTLSELEKKENCILYPFIGNWHTRLLEIAGYDFTIIKKFREMIVEQLKTWVTLSNYANASYYSVLFDFQETYNFALRLFSLNYDLCIEKNNPKGKNLERGFDPESRYWDSRRFDPPHEEPAIYLYKLHGSLDWERVPEKGNVVKEVDNIPEKPDLIFGTDYKLYYVDPYLYYASEFRRYSLGAKVILVIGYGFNDEHINSILEQALNYDAKKKLYIVSLNEDAAMSKFENKKDQVVMKVCKAKDYLEKELNIDKLEEDLRE